MNGDNDLESLVFHDLNELEMGASSDDVDVIVQADRIDGYDERDGDWTGTRRYHITHDDDRGTVTSEMVEDLGELDMGDPAVLADFLAWGAENYPSDHRILVLWDHGDGWSLGPQGAISWDDTDGGDISIAKGELAGALAPTVEAHGKFDIFATDACNMANWEVAYALRPYADFFVGSEATVGEAGLQYGPMLDYIVQDPTTDAGTLANDMAREATEVGEEWTFSATDLSKVDALAAAIDALAGAALGNPDLEDELLAFRDESRGADSEYENYYLDLLDFAQTVADGDDPTLAEPAAQVVEALAGAEVGTYGNVPYKWTGGLTTFFDLSDGYYVRLYAHGDGATWAQDTRWDDLMVEMLRSENAAL
jgi:hypothetical protein